MKLIDIEKLEYEPFILENGATVDYISAENLRKSPKVDPVNHGEWAKDVTIYPHNPSTVYITHTCSHCGRRELVDMYTVQEWEGYYKDRYEPKLPRFCGGCGYKMDLRKLYDTYKREWCEARGYILEVVEEKGGINGEYYAGFDEWYNNEYLESRGE